jgi:ribosomal protein L24E
MKDIYCQYCGKKLVLGVTPMRYLNPIKNLWICKPHCKQINKIMKRRNKNEETD